MRRRLSKKLSLLSNDSRGSYQAVTTIDETAPVDATQNEGPRKSRKWLSERRQKDDIEGWRGSIKVVLDSMVFQSFVALSILTNGVVIGFETDMPDLAIWNSVETVFLVIFTGELTLRLTVFGICSIFDMADSDFYWNVFDFAIVAMGIVDFLCTTFANLEAGSGATAFRLIRLLRILRIFKIVRFLKQLYLLAYGFVEAGKAVFWVTVLMLFALYICSVVLVRTFGGRQHESEAVQRLADTDFHSIPAAMLTLFQMMSEPDLTHFRPMFDEFPWFCPFLVIFTIFGSFGMIALLTGVISESMFEKNQLRVEEERQHREQLHSLLTERCLALFNEIDGDELNDNGEVPMEVFEDLLPEIAALFESHLVAFANHDLQELLDLMDLHGSGFIQKDAFCKGILSMAEGVRPMSIMQVMCAVLRTSAQVNECKEAIQKLSQRLPDCTASVSEVRHDEGSMQPRRQKNEAREAASCAESIRLERQQQQEQQQEQQEAPEMLETIGFGISTVLSGPDVQISESLDKSDDLRSEEGQEPTQAAAPASRLATISAAGPRVRLTVGRADDTQSSEHGAPVCNPRSCLNEFLSAYLGRPCTREDVVTSSREVISQQWVVNLTLGHLDGKPGASQSFEGGPASRVRDAEQLASGAAFRYFGLLCSQLACGAAGGASSAATRPAVPQAPAPPADAMTNATQDQPTEGSAVAAKPVEDTRSKLNHALQKYLQRDLTDSDLVVVCTGQDTKFAATITFNFEGRAGSGERFQGDIATNKRDARALASALAYQRMQELMEPGRGSADAAPRLAPSAVLGGGDGAGVGSSMPGVGAAAVSAPASAGPAEEPLQHASGGAAAAAANAASPAGGASDEALPQAMLELANPKGRLQELLMQKLRRSLTEADWAFRIVQGGGPGHRVALSVVCPGSEHIEIVSGAFGKLKDAEQDAARRVLWRLLMPRSGETATEEIA